MDSKALLNPKETLSALHVSRMRLHGHRYHIRDDPIRWAHFQRYLQLLPQHTLPWPACSRPCHGTLQFIRHVIEESIRVRYAHAKARAT